VQIALVQLAAQACITPEASDIVVNRIFVPTNVLLSVGIDENVGEVSLFGKGNLPLWDDNPSW